MGLNIMDSKTRTIEERSIDNINALTKAVSNHIALLSSFVRHDIKNSVQSIDSIISSKSLEELTQEDIDNLKLNLRMIRETIDNLSKLAPYGKEESFEFGEIVKAIELLNRESFYQIQFIKEIPTEKIYFNLSFQSVLQMINNVVINAIKAFEMTDNMVKRKIKFSAHCQEKIFILKIFDNAHHIIFDDPKTIFEYGVSSTGGSGIGLYHARYLCDLYKGDIQVQELEPNGEYTKYFVITLPII